MSDNDDIILFELVQSQSKHIDEIKKDINDMKLDVELIKHNIPHHEERVKKIKTAAATTGGGVGAMVAAFLVAILEWLRSHL